MKIFICELVVLTVVFMLADLVHSKFSKKSRFIATTSFVVVASSIFTYYVGISRPADLLIYAVATVIARIISVFLRKLWPNDHPGIWG